MKGIDTNVLVRYIVQDDRAQSKQATHFIEAHSEDDPIFVTGIILCELVWVLETAYHYPRKDFKNSSILYVSVGNFVASIARLSR